MKQWLIKNYKFILIVLLSLFLSFDFYLCIKYGNLSKGLFSSFYTSDVASLYVCMHLYPVTMLFSILTLIILCLFNKIDERIKFLSFYVSILHLMTYSILMIISRHIDVKASLFFTNIIWLTVAFISLPIFIFTVVFAIKNQEVLEVKEEKKQLELF